ASIWNTDNSFYMFAGINIVLNGDVFSTAWGGRTTLALDGSSNTFGVAWYNLTYGENMTVWQHEMGHAFGLAHSGSDTGVEYADAYDVMGYGYYAAPFLRPYVDWGEHTV